MAQSKVIIRGEVNDDVVFMGYGVKCDTGNEYTFAKFTLRFPHSNAADWILLNASANIWITNQAMLRKDEPRTKGLEGTVLDAAKNLVNQLNISMDDMLAVQSKDQLAETIRKAQLLMDSK